MHELNWKFVRRVQQQIWRGRRISKHEDKISKLLHLRMRSKQEWLVGYRYAEQYINCGSPRREKITWRNNGQKLPLFDETHEFANPGSSWNTEDDKPRDLRQITLSRLKTENIESIQEEVTNHITGVRWPASFSTDTSEARRQLQGWQI